MLLFSRVPRYENRQLANSHLSERQQGIFFLQEYNKGERPSNQMAGISQICIITWTLVLPYTKESRWLRPRILPSTHGSQMSPKFVCAIANRASNTKDSWLIKALTMSRDELIRQCLHCCVHKGNIICSQLVAFYQCSIMTRQIVPE